MPSLNNINLLHPELIRFRKRKVIRDLQSFLLLLLSVVIILFVILLILDSIFWLPTHIRYGVWWAGLIGSFILISIMIIGLFFIKQNRVHRYSFLTLSREVGEKTSEKPDQIINALQLASSEIQGTSQQLVNEYVQKIISKLHTLNADEIYSSSDSKRYLYTFFTTLILALFLTIGFQPQFQEAFHHWIHPRSHFPIPYPFSLQSVDGDLSIMGGDDVAIRFIGMGKTPKIITLELTGPNKKTFIPLQQQEDGTFLYELKEVFQNLHYRAYVQSHYFWQPWHEISSPTYTIEVIDRPTIEDFVVTISPPAYSQLNPVTQKGNIAEIQGLKGSKLTFHIRSNKKLSKAFFDYTSQLDSEKRKQIELKIDGKKATGSFALIEDGLLKTHIFDTRGINNLNPIIYHLMVTEDLSPEMQVIKPESPSELGSDFGIPIELHVEDDFGFSNLQIVYEVKHPEYVSAKMSGIKQDLVNIQTIKEISKTDVSQNIYTIWDVGNLNLVPEDEIRFHFELYDNDTVSGPKKAVSKTLIAQFPSIADLFKRTIEEESEVEDSIEDMVEELQTLDQTLESVELDLLKNRDLSWEQEQELKKSLEEMREHVKEVENLQEQIQNIIEQSEKHGLFSEELLEKFRNLNELLSEIITPELVKALEKLNKAIEQPSTEDLMEAIKDLRSNTAAMERELDRFIDIFKRVQAEQRMDELVTRIESLVKRQTEIVKKLDEEEGLTSQTSRLTEEQERNRQEFENLNDSMDNTADIISEFARLPAEELRELAQSDLSKQTTQDLSMAQQSLENKNYSTSVSFANASQQDLQQMSTQLQAIRQKFRQQTVAEMSEEFEQIFHHTLYLSKHQEKLHRETEALPHNSPRLGEMAGKQQLLKDQLAQMVQSVFKLSQKTFFVSPDMGKAIGRASVGMIESLSKLEERNGRMASKSQIETVGALNDFALDVLGAMEAMQQSGMASGFEQFIQRMQQMIGQQQGINAQTLQLALGQMAAQSQEAFMKRLTQKQGQLKKSLEQMIREMRGAQKGGGNLKGIVEEMEEVLKDFQRRRVNPQTVKSQERILTRMLDFQKSLRKRDFSEKRRSMTAQDIIRVGPGGLPEDLGQRRNLAIEALNLALKSGYPKDYQDMIRRYFNALVQTPQIETKDETP